MADRRTNEPQGLPERGRESTHEAESTPAPGPTPAAEASAPVAERVSFYIGSDGAPIWDRMHAGTREKIERLVGRAPGGGAAHALNPKISAALASAVVATVPALVQIALRVSGFTAESVARVQLDERTRGELAPLYAAALADYNVMLGRHENLIVALGMTALALAPAFEKLERAKKPNGSAGGPLINAMMAAEEERERPAS